MADVTAYLMQKFFTEFNEDVICHFRQGYVDDDLGWDVGPTYMQMSTDTVVEKPNNEVYMSVNLVDGTTNNTSIGTQILKQDSVSLVFRIYTPRPKSFKRDTELRAALDPIFLNKRFAESEFEIQPDSASPMTRDLDMPSGDDGMFIRTVSYRFEVRYF